MALPGNQCMDPRDPCCDHFYVIADHILEIAHTAVVQCMVGLDCLSPLEGYVSIGTRINDPVSDYLVVSLVGIRGPSGGGENKMVVPYYRAHYQVRLLESGWPLPQSDGAGIGPPAGDEYTYASRFSMAHAQVMFRAVNNALMANTINPYCRAGCYQHITDLVPVEPSGGSVGWEFNVIVDADLMTPYPS